MTKIRKCLIVFLVLSCFFAGSFTAIADSGEPGVPITGVSGTPIMPADNYVDEHETSAVADQETAELSNPIPAYHGSPPQQKIETNPEQNVPSTEGNASAPTPAEEVSETAANPVINALLGFVAALLRLIMVLLG